MNEGRTQRRLAAIMAADVVGFSRLMGRDEVGTLADLKSHRREMIDNMIDTHEGRIFKLTGDGMLVEFSSVVNALACAVEIQRSVRIRNADVPEERRIAFRIGVHLGDILVEDDDIFGDGVNVAARIESMAQPGGVCVSGAVRDNVGNRLDLSFEDRGEESLKNIDHPVRLFDVALEPPPTSMQPEQRQKASIAVLPFANMSGDPEQEYFSDGITEDIITNLSKISALGVMARNTSFQFKNRNVDVAVVARQMKVSHILEGSVRKAGDRVRITAQLIYGTSGEHVWAERYDRELNDIFTLQDEISETIANVLKLKLLPEEKALIEGRATTDPQTYKFYLMARHFIVTGSVRHQAIVVRICQHALERDPEFAPTWALLAITLATQRIMGEPVKGGMEAAERALELDPNLADAYAAKGRVLIGMGRLKEAMSELQNALRLEPDSYQANAIAGRCAAQAQNYEKAAGFLETATRAFSAGFWAPGMLVNIYQALGRTKDVNRSASVTLERAEKVVALEPDNGTALSFGVLALLALSETERAFEWAERALLLDPDNGNMKYNLACAFVQAGQIKKGLDLLAETLKTAQRDTLRWLTRDADLVPVRNHPRYKAMIADTEVRLGVTTEG